MKEIVKRYKVEFNVPKYNAEYSFTLTKSASFSYGNGTCVVFKKNGKVDSVLDISGCKEAAWQSIKDGRTRRLGMSLFTS